jgi:Zn finger protein HypA/HybF involved in hydrogenase expression
MKITKYCKNCNKKLSKNTIGQYCNICYPEIRKQERIKSWLNTGKLKIGLMTTLRYSIRNYIYESQNNKCAICGLERNWNNKELKFILDHINGDASNNSKENLRLICPNCDSQLDTYKHKNKNSARKERYKLLKNKEDGQDGNATTY